MSALRPHEVKDQGHTETIPVFAYQGAMWGPGLFLALCLLLPWLAW